MHVSAEHLINPNAPASLMHHSKMHPSDKKVWDEAYAEEYHGLHKELDAFEYITEEEYETMKKVLGQKLPSIAISTIKYDQDGKPVRAKYRICALGNLDHHDWSQSDTFAPVLSQNEMRLLVSEAIKLNIIPKTADFKQSFCQAVLPKSETYVLLPPNGCPITPPRTYLLLKKTLYGLKRSPRHWFQKACEILNSIGLKQIPNSPCIFQGTIIPGQPPLTLGLYVDDCIYFSESNRLKNILNRN